MLHAVQIKQEADVVENGPNLARAFKRDADSIAVQNVLAPDAVHVFIDPVGSVRIFWIKGAISLHVHEGERQGPSDGSYLLLEQPPQAR